MKLKKTTATCPICNGKGRVPAARGDRLARGAATRAHIVALRRKGHTYAQIAHLVGCSVPNVQYHLRRKKQDLKGAGPITGHKPKRHIGFRSSDW